MFFSLLIKILISKYVLLISARNANILNCHSFPYQLEWLHSGYKLCHRVNQHFDLSHGIRWLTKIVIDLQNLTLIGALLYYIGLKHTVDNLDDEEKNKQTEGW